LTKRIYTHQSDYTKVSYNQIGTKVTYTVVNQQNNTYNI